MAGTNNPVAKGNPHVTWNYLNLASSPSFNKLLLNLVTPGIYKGLTLSVDAGLNPYVSSGVAFVNTNNSDWENQLGIRVELQAGYAVPGWSSATPYIVLRYFWVSTTQSYPDILCVTSPDATTDVILGKFTTITSTGSLPDLSERMDVRVFADGIHLHTALLSNPTGGTATNLSADQFIFNALTEIFDRLVDLSGVRNDAVLNRHVNWGVKATPTDDFIDNSVIPSTNTDKFSDSTTPGADGASVSLALASGDTASGVFTKLVSAIKKLAGVQNGSVTNRLMNWGKRSNNGDTTINNPERIDTGVIPSANTDAWGKTGSGAPEALENGEALKAAITKIVNAINGLAGVADGSVTSRLVDTSTVNGDLLKIKAATTGVAITSGTKIDAAIQALADAIVAETSARAAQTGDNLTLGKATTGPALASSVTLQAAIQKAFDLIAAETTARGLITWSTLSGAPTKVSAFTNDKNYLTAVPAALAPTTLTLPSTAAGARTIWIA